VYPVINAKLIALFKLIYQSGIYLEKFQIKIVLNAEGVLKHALKKHLYGMRKLALASSKFIILPHHYLA